jgi:hypothetical protein
MDLHISTLSTLPFFFFACRVDVLASVSCSQRTLSVRFELFSLGFIEISGMLIRGDL